jgi:hypothetical protein
MGLTFETPTGMASFSVDLLNFCIGIGPTNSITLFKSQTHVKKNLNFSFFRIYGFWRTY